MGDFKSRLFEEHSDLTIKIDKLTTFVTGSKTFDDLPEIERKDLKEQLKHMKNYYNVLNRRVNRSCS
jgi:hypothetical protein